MALFSCKPDEKRTSDKSRIIVADQTKKGYANVPVVPVLISQDGGDGLLLSSGGGTLKVKML
jgi:hypothetical protein